MTERIGGGYSRGQQAVETLAVAGFFAGTFLLIVGLARVSFTYWLIPVTIVSIIAGALLSDLVSGVVHWACDTWGTIDAPIFGRVFIRQFREHHVDPEEINRHDFVETNGTNAGLALLPLTGAWALPLDLEAPGVLVWIMHVVLISLAFFTTITSQAHKWAHAKTRPNWVSWLQRSRLILSPEHHAVHHVSPHRHHYSITGGWVDRWLERGRVFRHAEAMIMRVTGARMAHEIELSEAESKL